MAARTVQDQVSALLSRSVVEQRQPGSEVAGLEASAVFESVALSLLLTPRLALYFEHLARNGLCQVVTAELNLLTTLAQDIKDLANLSYKIEGEESLIRARTALLQLEGLPRIDANQTALSLFEKSVEEFLQGSLSKNVRRRGASDFVRPASEALQDLPGTATALKAKHDELLGRLYALAVGVDNFLSAPFTALLGTAAVSRARADLEAILAEVQAGGDPANARDYATRLIASRAAIRSVASPPDLAAPVYDGQASTPGGLGISAAVADQRTVCQVGDQVQVFSAPAATCRAVAVSKDVILLDNPLPVFSGRIMVTSSLVLMHEALAPGLKTFLQSWNSSLFFENLDRLDRALAPLLASQSPATRGDANDMVQLLTGQLTTLLNTITDPTTMLPAGAAAQERLSVEGILNTLEERRYDRAADLVLRCDLASLLEMNADQASYAGNFLRASSVFAQAGAAPAALDTDAPGAIGPEAL
jgi:hypothetical protein